MSGHLKRKSESLALDSTKKSKVNASITSFFGPPKIVSSTTSASKAAGATGNSAASAASSAADTSAKFNKAKWVEGLTAEQKELLKLEIDTLHESWLAHLKDEVTRPEFLDLKRFLKKEELSGKKIFPPSVDVYSWSRHTPLNTVKAVILGQDPYHNVNQAHGLAFSVRPPTPTPPSLRNMYICLKNDYPSFVVPPKNSGLLTPWADRGVLLINTCLTVRAHEANSHANHGWERFTQKVIDTVAKVRTRGVVFLAWGTPAGKRVMKIDTTRHLVLKSVHPSPLSASRGFFTCKHFLKTNEWLKMRYGPDAEIDWDLTGEHSTLSTPRPAAAVAAATEETAHAAKGEDASAKDDKEGTSKTEAVEEKAAEKVEKVVEKAEKVPEKVDVQPEDKENDTKAAEVVEPYDDIDEADFLEQE